MSFSLVQGDLEPDMLVPVTDENGPVNLSSAIAFNMRWRKPDGTVVTVELLGVDLPNGILKRVWAAGDSDIVGVHRGQVVITTANSEFQTYPNNPAGAYVLWFVTKQLNTLGL